MTDFSHFNPLDKRNLGASVAVALLDKKPMPLGKVPAFSGAGIYAIYYTGTFEAYSTIATRNRDGSFEAPIYVGKAVPEGARKGGIASAGDRATKVLQRRLAEHADSINSARNLDIKDFYCRFLIVDDIWIPLGESLLIAKFSPIWNTLIDGFGNHDPGRGRYAGMRPKWDVLHPGRNWALKCMERQESADQIALEASEFLRSHPIPRSAHFYAEQLRQTYAQDSDS